MTSPPPTNASRTVRIAVVGVGNVGSVHARELLLEKVPGARLAAVCDLDPEALARFPGVPGFSDSAALLASGLADAVLIATPHYSHTPFAVAALGKGLHVLTEKPLAVHKADALKMIAAYDARPNPGQVFAEMFSLRIDPRFVKLRELLRTGELGAVQRINWTTTNWLRTNAYYRGSPWRATWRGEGGGLLQNQCPHSLDAWQWLFGMPARVHAFCGLGRFHEIEVEDSVTAYLEYETGASGVYVASTGETPGTERLEVVGDLGKAVLGSGGLKIWRNARGAREVIARGPSRAVISPVTPDELPLSPAENPRLTLIRNFVSAILEGDELIAPACEGLFSVELANAMSYSSLTKQTVTLPLDPALYAAELERLMATSRCANKP
jgi:predicted dehydrogenase